MMNCDLPIVIVGTGGAARSWIFSLKNRNYPILGVVSRGSDQARKYIHQAELKEFSFSNIFTKPCICILSVPDQLIAETASRMQLASGSILVHCAGSVDLREISNYGHNCGVIYPLQTLHPLKTVDFKDVSLCVEASNAKTLETIRRFASLLSDNVHDISGTQRRTLHLAAVFACNFTNYMYSISEELLKQNNLDFSLLSALITETAHKAIAVSPSQSQTGPAVRGDFKTIEKHLALLSGQNKEIYRLLSDIISKKHSKV